MRIKEMNFKSGNAGKNTRIAAFLIIGMFLIIGGMLVSNAKDMGSIRFYKRTKGMALFHH